jgi:hypothetical protein
VSAASRFTSPATTAKPRPASPARAASISAFSASRLMRLAMSWIVVTICDNWAIASDSCVRAAVMSVAILTIFPTWPVASTTGV